jgi:hypothetical protein
MVMGNAGGDSDHIPSPLRRIYHAKIEQEFDA